MQSKLKSVYPEKNTIGSSNNVGALDNHSLPRHRWYFIEAFSPQVVDVALGEALRQYADSGLLILSAEVELLCSLPH